MPAVRHISSPALRHASLAVQTQRPAACQATPAHAVHPYATLVYVTQGSATIWCGASYGVRAGEVILIPEGMPHQAVWSAEAEVVGVLLCSACLRTPAGLHLAAMLREVAAGAVAVRTLSPAAQQSLHGTLQALAQELQEPRLLQDQAIEGYLSLVAVLLRRAGPHLSDAAPSASLSARALAFISQHAVEKISLRDVARHIHRSPAHTAAVVKADTDRTVVAWIQLARLAQVRERLLRTDDTVESIAAQVGFASPSQLYRVFRRHHGSTPTQWRCAHQRPGAAAAGGTALG